MTIVIDFAEAKAKKEETVPRNLNEFLKKAKQLINETSHGKTSEIITIIKDINDLKRKIEGVISKKIIDDRMIDKGLFLCGVYVPHVFTEYLSSSPKSWIAYDYKLESEKKESAFTFKQGGDVCFLICSIFTERAKWRAMNPSYYHEMGESFYYQFYAKTDKEIGYHMSDNFKTIVNITKECIHSI